MSDTAIKGIMDVTMDKIRAMVDADTIIGKEITLENGIVIIPVSKISVGFATGGLDIPTKRTLSHTNFGGGSGTGVSITPVAFLTVGKNAEINLIPIGNPESTAIDRACDLIENSPTIIEKIKNTFSD